MTKKTKAPPKARASKAKKQAEELVLDPDAFLAAANVLTPVPEGSAPAKKRKPYERAKAELPPPPEHRTRDEDIQALRAKVRYFYDIQRLRLQAGGRNLKKAEGLEIQLHPYDQALLLMRAAELHGVERQALKDVQEHLDSIPFYRNVLSDKERYRGIGPTMAGVIMSEFDIHRADTASQFWSFAGLAPIAAARCKKCSTVVEPIEVGGDGEIMFMHPKNAKGMKCDSAGEHIPGGQTFGSGKTMKPQKGVKLPFNARLRSKLVGVLGPVMLKVGSPWRKEYDDYKLRKQSAQWGRSDAHRHQAAIRYMIKMLLLDIWLKWREHEKLAVRPPYSEEKLGHKHQGGALENNRQADTEALSPEAEEELKLLG